jgi:hypothetical protein
MHTATVAKAVNVNRAIAGVFHLIRNMVCVAFRIKVSTEPERTPTEHRPAASL